ncbi:MAG TPA: hypothetical protein VG755_15835 [Nannocystaceae bacterium]|nr:hypothetical protein [Nannocystaceae bacterium]
MTLAKSIAEDRDARRRQLLSHVDESPRLRRLTELVDAVAAAHDAGEDTRKPQRVLDEYCAELGEQVSTQLLTNGGAPDRLTEWQAAQQPTSPFSRCSLDERMRQHLAARERALLLLVLAIEEVTST